MRHASKGFVLLAVVLLLCGASCPRRAISMPKSGCNVVSGVVKVGLKLDQKAEKIIVDCKTVTIHEGEQVEWNVTGGLRDQRIRVKGTNLIFKHKFPQREWTIGPSSWTASSGAAERTGTFKYRVDMLRPDGKVDPKWLADPSVIIQTDIGGGGGTTRPH